MTLQVDKRRKKKSGFCWRRGSGGLVTVCYRAARGLSICEGKQRGKAMLVIKTVPGDCKIHNRSENCGGSNGEDGSGKVVTNVAVVARATTWFSPMT